MGRVIPNISEHTAALPRLYDELVDATARPSRMEHQRAMDVIDKMVARLNAARTLIKYDAPREPLV
jgi:hypothetical protein